MKHVHYDETTNQLLGFYSDDIHKDIPEPNFMITDADWQKALKDGSNYVDIDTKTLYKRPQTDEELLTEAKKKRKAELREEFINDALAAKYNEVDAAVTATDIKNVKLK